MEQIQTEKKLFNWLYKHVLDSEPQIVVTPGLVHIGSEIAEMGYLARYDYDCWVDTFDDIFSKVAEPGEARCGRLLIAWLAEVYAQVAGGDPYETLPLQRVNRSTVTLLKFEPRYLRVCSNGGRDRVKSTDLCEQKFSTRIRVTSPVLAEREMRL
jgi:hypothetical protein